MSIDGVVLTFTDITALKKTEGDARAARDYAESIVDAVRVIVRRGAGERKQVRRHACGRQGASDPYFRDLSNPNGYTVFQVYKDERGPQGYFAATRLGR